MRIGTVVTQSADEFLRQLEIKAAQAAQVFVPAGF